MGCSARGAEVSAHGAILTMISGPDSHRTAPRHGGSLLPERKADEGQSFIRLLSVAAAAGNTFVAAAIALTLCILASLAHANPSPADMGLDKSAATGNFSVLDRSGTWVAVGAVNSTTHAIAIPNASLANTATTVGGASCALGAACSPATTVGGTACGLGGSCAPTLTINGVTCTLGGSCTPTSAASVVVNTTPTSGGAAGQLMFDTGSVLTESATLVFTTPTLKIVSNTGALALGTAADTILTRDAANAFGQRNGTTAQLFSVYQTFTNASNYARAAFDFQKTANVLTIGTEALGTGGVLPLQFVEGSQNIGDYGVTGNFWTFGAGGIGTTALGVSGATALHATTVAGNMTATGTVSGPTVSATTMTSTTLTTTSNILASGGNITAGAGALVAGGSATVTTGQIGYSNIVTVSSACGTLSGAAGCFKINVAGTDHFVPYY